MLENDTRVVHIIAQLNPGGVERRTLELVKHSKRCGIDHFIYLTSGKEGKLDEEYKEQGVYLRYMKIRSPSFWLELYKVFREDLIDVVHSNIMYMSAPVILVAWAAGVKKRIVHFRNDGNLSKENLSHRIKKSLLKKIINRFATDIVGLTPQNLTLAWSPAWRKDKRCSIVPNGVELPIPSTPVAPDIAPFSTQTIIVHVGRADLATKNREKAITVFGQYVRSNPNSVLFFIGRDGKNERQASEQLEKWKILSRSYDIEDRVFFCGEKSSIMPYLFGADMFLFTSTKEGLPGVIIEAIASGLPVVSSDVPGAQFIEENSERVVTLSPSLADSAWAAELLKLSPKLSPLERAENMKAFSSSIFTIDNSVRKYVNLWTRN